MHLDRRQKTYLVVRLSAAALFVLAVVAMPRGPASGIVAMLAGFIGFATCLGSLAGGPGESAGAHPQDRFFDSVRAPQGDWPPYVAARAEAAAREASRES